MSLEGEVTGLRFRLEKCESDMATSLAAAGGGMVLAAAAPISTPINPDDLKLVEGIGPKIEQLCNAIGVWTFDQLASTSVENLQKMLQDGGPAYRTADPATWPHQAQLAAEGKWDELKTYQERLVGGKEPNA